MNPFKPTAGKMPPELIGRDFVVEEFQEGLRNGPGAPERLMRITGSRGMGKTVMLNELGRIAKQNGWNVVAETASEGFCTRILNSLSPRSRVSQASIQPSALGVELGSLSLDLAPLSLREAIAKATKKNGLLITLDEVQDASIDEIRALAVAIQHSIGDDLNIAFAFAGLSSMVDRVVNGKTLTFLRRAFPENLSPLCNNEVALSYQDTVRTNGMRISDDVANFMALSAQGYPFMVQLVGYYTWKAAQRRGSGSVDQIDADQGSAMAREQFDRMVIEPALQDVSPMALRYLLAMAEDEGIPSRTGDIAQRLDKSLTELSSCRDRLIRESVIEPAGRGFIAFAIPYMKDYLAAHRSELLAELP
ncbi:MAG: ATP-binding protein [Eggerthellaceae bacterium]|nr:ATP-binding protein [Eggerthellaceae bacterium]